MNMPFGNYSSFAELFRRLLFISQSRPFTLMLDEFQDWLRVNPSVFREMQREWDLAKATSKMNLIVGGSIYSLMHRIFEDSKEPLFSRANRIIHLRAFGTDVLKEILQDFNPAYSAEDLLTLYSLTHGVAWYVGLFMGNGKGENEIDLVAANEIDGIAGIFGVKKDKNRYNETLLRTKVENMQAVCPELKKYKISLACLSMEDM